MLRTIWFQLHWFFGITAGIILMVVGVTGGLLSFEQEILRALNPGVMTVTPTQPKKLSPAELLINVQEALPERQITAVTLHRAPRLSAQVTLTSSDPSQRRGETRYVDPYTGALLNDPRGIEFFRGVMQLHRWFLTDRFFDNRDLGKHIVGASTVLLILLSLTGVYLRWPRQVLNLKTWLTFSLKRKGRGFIWDMHAVLGTWVLLLYLLASVTGLYWSYDWYRNAMHNISGVPRMTRPMPQPETTNEATAERRSGRERQQATAPTPLPIRQLENSWELFTQTVDNNYSRAALRLPGLQDETVTITYLAANARHVRATDRLTVNPFDGTIVGHDRYQDRPLNVRLMSSMLPLHDGSYFGVTGKVLMMIASLAMPLFTITGWMLYLQRRKNKSTVKRVVATIEKEPSPDKNSSILIGYASQSGFAEGLAWKSAAKLQQAGCQVQVKPLNRITPEQLSSMSQGLFLVSTFGDGVPPDNARAFFQALKEAKPDLSGFHYQLLSLGDRSYEHFCQCGRLLDEWLRQRGGYPQYPAIEVDDGDPVSLEVWDEQLDQIALASP